MVPNKIEVKFSFFTFHAMWLIPECMCLVLSDEVALAAVRPPALAVAVVHDPGASLVLVRVREVVRHPHVVAHLVSDHLHVCKLGFNFFLNVFLFLVSDRLALQER